MWKMFLQSQKLIFSFVKCSVLHHSYIEINGFIRLSIHFLFHRLFICICMYLCICFFIKPTRIHIHLPQPQFHTINIVESYIYIYIYSRRQKPNVNIYTLLEYICIWYTQPKTIFI